MGRRKPMEPMEQMNQKESMEQMEQKKTSLQPSEWILMERLWERSPQTIMQLYHSLRENPGWSKSTVNTMLKRMSVKGLIRYEEGDRAKLFYPTLERDDAAIVETESLLERVYNGSVSMMMNTLIRNKNISDEEIRELRRILGENDENA